MVGFFPTVDELRLHAYRLAGDQVLDLSHLVVPLIPANNFLEHSPKLAALPGIEVAFQLGLAHGRRVLAIQLAEDVSEQETFARAFHD
ncbi:hypothetical protein D3C86_1830130 [compost metagenome]